MEYVIGLVAVLFGYILGLVITLKLLKTQSPGSAGAFGCFWWATITVIAVLYDLHRTIFSIVAAIILIFIFIILLLKIRR